MEKINFSGGEPFIHDRGDHLGELVRYCKQDLRLESVTIVSNGSLIRKSWFKKYGEFVILSFTSLFTFPFFYSYRTMIGLLLSIRGLPGHLGHLV